VGADAAGNANNIRIKTSRNLRAAGITAGSLDIAAAGDAILNAANNKQTLYRVLFRGAGAAFAGPGAGAPSIQNTNLPVGAANDAIIDK